jgi:hypothetical protein
MIRRFTACFAALTAAVMLFAANPAAAGLSDRAEPATSGEAVAAPAPQAPAAARTAALASTEQETTGSAERTATPKRATAAKPAVSRRAAQPARKEYRARTFTSAVRVAATPVSSYGANCHRR